jgi:DNA polymerase-1
MSEPVVALLDADIFVFQVASAVEKEIDWGNDLWTLHSDFNKARERLDSAVEAVKYTLNAEEVILCFTDGVNFRKSVLPTYKWNRKATRKPLVYKALVQYCIDNYSTYTRPNLEADDVMGILATWPAFRPGKRKVIVSEDKDLKTIAGAWLYNPAKDTEAKQTDPAEAFRYFMEQTLTGDTTDGYGGCPGIGPDSAQEILDEPFGWEQYEHTFKSGPRKGAFELKWRRCKVDSLWEAIVSHYVKAGLSEDVALQNARCARILHATDYNFKTKEPILWSPRKSPAASI